jgi:hypothetical protein
MKTELGVVGPKKDEMLQWPSYKKWDLVSQSRLKQEFDKTKVSRECMAESLNMMLPYEVSYVYK